MNVLIQTDGMHGWSYLSPDDLIVFASKALDFCDNEDDNTISAANNILTEKPTSKDRMKLLYKELIDAIEVADLTESMEICSDCGAIPETGACNYCKMD